MKLNLTRFEDEENFVRSKFNFSTLSFSGVIRLQTFGQRKPYDSTFFTSEPMNRSVNVKNANEYLSNAGQLFVYYQLGSSQHQAYNSTNDLFGHIPPFEILQ